MKKTASTKAKMGLVLLSTMVATVLFVGTYEVIQHVKYYRWKAKFDNSGWMNKITIPSPNSALMWEYRPNGKHQQIEVNRYGFRDRDYDSTAKPPNTVRVAFIGDSVTLGMGVELEETFVRQFEKEANRLKPQPRVQALNFAVDGYNTTQISEMLRAKVLDFSPDKVVYVMCLNDFDFEQSSGDKILYFRKPNSFFLQKMDRVYQRTYKGDFHEFHFNKRKDTVFRNILDMKNLLEGKGSFQVVVLPIFPENEPLFEDYPLREMHKEIRTFLRANDVRFLDLLEVLDEQGMSRADLATDIYHLNGKGHRIIAEKLLPSVLTGD